MKLQLPFSASYGYSLLLIFVVKSSCHVVTCCTEAASAQGSLPLVSSLGVSLGGLNFIPTLLLEPREELDLQMILEPLSFLLDTILTGRAPQITLNNQYCPGFDSHYSMSLHSGLLAVSLCHRSSQLLTLASLPQNSYQHSSPAQITQEF